MHFKDCSDPLESLQNELTDLRTRLRERDQHIRHLESCSEASEEAIGEWQDKYDRLWEAHRKLQKTNHSLEDKLLRIVDKFEADKNQVNRENHRINIKFTFKFIIVLSVQYTCST